jgi:hypothetical protein
MFGKLIKAVGPEGRLQGGGDALDRLRALAALGIVIASVCSAIAVLAGAVFDEHGSQDDAVYRQQLVTKQQLGHQREENIAADVALFGDYAQQVLRARDLQRGASVEPNPRLARALRAKAEGRRAIATAMLARFHVLPWETTNGFRLAYNPSAAYRVQSHTALALDEALDPGEHRLAARSARHDGMSMAGVAALFLIALVLFTFAQVYARFRTPEKKEKQGDDKEQLQLGLGLLTAEQRISASVLRHAYAMVGAGTLVLLSAIFLGLQTAL